jgi:hypothetical protein
MVRGVTLESRLHPYQEDDRGLPDNVELCAAP